MGSERVGHDRATELNRFNTFLRSDTWLKSFSVCLPTKYSYLCYIIFQIFTLILVYEKKPGLPSWFSGKEHAYQCRR